MILSGHDNVEKDQLFKMATELCKYKASSNQIEDKFRGNVFSVRVRERWNLIPTEIK
jgi:hypothetical protein